MFSSVMTGYGPFSHGWAEECWGVNQGWSFSDLTPEEDRHFSRRKNGSKPTDGSIFAELQALIYAPGSSSCEDVKIDPAEISRMWRFDPAILTK